MQFTSRDFSLDSIGAGQLDQDAFAATEWITKYLPGPQYRLSPDDLEVLEVTAAGEETRS